MSESDEIWAEVARRAAVSRFSGATADDDDVIRGAEFLEGALNPNKQGAAGGVGGPGMMPPMMMGGMGGGAGGGGATGGLAAAGGAAASTPPANLPQPSAAVGIGVAATAAPVAEPQPEEPAMPDMPAGPGGGGPSAGGGAGGEPMPPLDAELPAASAGAAAPVDGFHADPVVLRGLAARWAEVAQDLHGLEVASAEVELGLVEPPQRPQQAVQQQLGVWTVGAASEFDAIVARLQDVAGQYEAVEDSGVAQIRKETADD